MFGEIAYLAGCWILKNVTAVVNWFIIWWGIVYERPLFSPPIPLFLLNLTPIYFNNYVRYSTKLSDKLLYSTGNEIKSGLMLFYLIPGTNAIACYRAWLNNATVHHVNKATWPPQSIMLISQQSHVMSLNLNLHISVNKATWLGH